MKLSDRMQPAYQLPNGLDENVVRGISHYKKEPSWMLKKRLEAYRIFQKKNLPLWASPASKLDISDLCFYIKSTERKVFSWDELPSEIRDTYDRIGMPEAEKKYLGGVNAQYESEAVYESIQKSLKSKGVIFMDMDSALKEYPEIIRQYFGTVVPAFDNRFSALNTAVWSGGSFVYVPEGVHIDLPLQAYFMISSARMGQFERTMIIAEEGSYVHYTEGCTAPIYSGDSLHAGVVEIVVKKNARVRYSTVQNWSKNVYNLVTKRMHVFEGGVGEWIDGNIGSKITMKYPSVYLMGKGAKGDILSLSFAKGGQRQDTGGKALHFAPYTSSRIVSKSVSVSGGRTSYRGLVRILPDAKDCRTRVVCDALITDGFSRSDTYPEMDIKRNDAIAEHEAYLSRISEEQLFYLESRGIPKGEAESIIVNGFIEPVVRELPMEYAVELNRLISLEMEGSVG